MAAQITVDATNSALDLTRRLRYVTAVHVVEIGTTPAPGRFYLRDGSASGAVFIPLAVDAGGGATVTYTTPIHFPNGVFVQVSTGTLRYAISGY